jgi:exopolyphosphatase/guanosine-5'-triphosphate,3'-diphosphate pyrophosphatase
MEQNQLSMMVLAHRGSLAKLRGLVRQDHDWSLLVALRLAALFNRSRSEMRLPLIRAARKKSAFTVEVDVRWLEANPLTAAELRDEVKDWKQLGIDLAVPQLAELESIGESLGAN